MQAIEEVTFKFVMILCGTYENWMSLAPFVDWLQLQFWWSISDTLNMYGVGMQDIIKNYNKFYFLKEIIGK